MILHRPQPWAGPPGGGPDRPPAPTDRIHAGSLSESRLAAHVDDIDSRDAPPHPTGDQLYAIAGSRPTHAYCVEVSYPVP